MSVKLNRPPNPEESQKDSNFNGKTISNPGFEPRNSGLGVSSHRCWSPRRPPSTRIVLNGQEVVFGGQISGSDPRQETDICQVDREGRESFII
jgi:hypothetical protein